MKFSTGNNYAVIMKTPFTEKAVVTYETEKEAAEEAAKAQALAIDRGYTEVSYRVAMVA